MTKEPKKKSTAELLAAARAAKSPPPMPARRVRGKRAGYGGEYSGRNYKPLLPVIDVLWGQHWARLQIALWLCQQGHARDDRREREKESGGRRWTEVPGEFRYLYQAVAHRCRRLEERAAAMEPASE